MLSEEHIQEDIWA